MPVEPPVTRTALPARSGMTRRRAGIGGFRQDWGPSGWLRRRGASNPDRLGRAAERGPLSPDSGLSRPRPYILAGTWRRLAMIMTRKLAAILVADIVGFSRLAGADEDRILA